MFRPLPGSSTVAVRSATRPYGGSTMGEFGASAAVLLAGGAVVAACPVPRVASSAASHARRGQQDGDGKRGRAARGRVTAQHGLCTPAPLDASAQTATPTSQRCRPHRHNAPCRAGVRRAPLTAARVGLRSGNGSARRR